MKFNLKEIKQAYETIHDDWATFEDELLRHRSAEEVVAGQTTKGIRRFKRLFTTGSRIKHIEYHLDDNKMYHVYYDGTKKLTVGSLDSCLECVKFEIWEEI